MNDIDSQQTMKYKSTMTPYGIIGFDKGYKVPIPFGNSLRFDSYDCHVLSCHRGLSWLEITLSNNLSAGAVGNIALAVALPL